MEWWQTLCLLAYFAVIVILSIYGLHRHLMVILYYKHKRKVPKPKGIFPSPPQVTVQLPIYNERYVVERLIRAVSKIDYPEELLEIQVLDDSTDVTAKIAQNTVEDLKAKGHDISYIPRHNRKGFKAGALAGGLIRAKGDFIAIFDADFVPGRDFLVRTIDHFADKEVGMVQTRWGHLNSDYSLLTKIQAMFLDGHFVIEHNARNRSERFFNFNGTAGIWRKDCILSSGGWQHDTLTEDLDLSYRAQMGGWKFVFLDDVVSPAELPVEIDAFKSQQHRWSKGSIQTAKKLLPQLLRTKLPFHVKLEALFHLTNNLSYLFMFLLTLLILPVLIIRADMGWQKGILIDIPLLWAATGAISWFYISSQKEIYANWKRMIKYLPGLMSLGIGLCVNNTRAVLEALLNHRTGFTRTPKYHIVDRGDSWRDKVYTNGKRLSFMELFLALYCSFSTLFALTNQLFASLPFLLLFQAGFVYMVFTSLFQGGKATHARATA